MNGIVVSHSSEFQSSLVGVSVGQPRASDQSQQPNHKNGEEVQLLGARAAFPKRLWELYDPKRRYSLTDI